MAEPNDGAFIADDALEIFQTQYNEEFLEQSPDRLGQTTNKLFSPAEDVVNGVGFTQQYNFSRPDGARWGTDPLAGSPSPSYFRANSISYRWSQTGTNDFSSIMAAVRKSFPDMLNMGRAAIIDLTQYVYNQVVPDFETKLAIHRQVPRSARIGTVTATPTLNDNLYLASCTSTATNTGGARWAVANGSISWYQPGYRIDVYSSAGVLRAANIEVKNPNTVDGSIGVAFNSATTPGGSVSSGNLATIAAGDYVYLSGERNKGMYSLAEWFSLPTSTDSFAGGVNRSTSDYSWMIPTLINAGAASSVKVTRSQFNSLALAKAYQIEKEVGGVWSGPPDIINTLRLELGENAFFQIPTADTRLARFMHFGSQGLFYQDPAFGTVQIVSDPMHTPGMIRYNIPETCKTHYYGAKGLIPVSGGGSPAWERLPDSTPGNGFGKFWQADWVAYMFDEIRQPWRCGAILNLTA